MRDRIIAISDRIPRHVALTTELAAELGYLRPSDADGSWVDDTRAALQQGHRAVLAGDLETLRDGIHHLAHLKSELPKGRFALSIHWTQALEFALDAKYSSFFCAIYIAVDEEISRELIGQISNKWGRNQDVNWVFAPREGLNWIDWIPKNLRPERRGSLLLFPVFISADEIRLHLDEFSLEHPLINFQPLPHEWYLPHAVGPWGRTTRDESTCLLFADHRKATNYDLSIVIPFRWTGTGTELTNLNTCLESVVQAFPASTKREIIISVDRDFSASMFEVEDLRIASDDLVIFESSRAETIQAESDWRAGYIRNRGASVRKNQTGYLVFIDSDIAIAESTPVRERVLENRFQLIQLSNQKGETGFQNATSALVAIKAKLFEDLGGFAGAFTRYGCEDNFLIWQSEMINVEIGTFNFSNVRHLREATEQDDLVAKMLRIQSSAQLMYKMTLDPEVHRHFYSTLGDGLWLRATIKRLCNNLFGRFLLSPLVFAVTMLETRSRFKYLRGFHDVVIWKLKRPVIWLRSNSWKTAKLSHLWKAHAWKIPNFFSTHFGEAKIVLQRTWISMKASKFGWAAAGWRISTFIGRIYNKIFWKIKTLSAHMYRQISWRSRVARTRASGRILFRTKGTIEWMWGNLRGLSIRISGTIKKFFVLRIIVPFRFVATRPYHFARSHFWRLEKMSHDLNAEAWGLREPTAWFAKRAPHFYQRVWRPLLKIRFFLEYHLVTRWRKPS